MDEKITYRQQVSFCGKPRCRKCRAGIGHGPYWFAYRLTPEGRTVRTYIGKYLPPGVRMPASHALNAVAQRGDVGRSNQSPLVGREAEREKLRQLLVVAAGGVAAHSRAGASPAMVLQRLQPRCAILMGEAGIGKTRLAEETAREALQSGWAVVLSHAYAQESGIPYRQWSELVRDLIAQGLWDAADAGQAQVYTPLMALLPELREQWGDVKEPDQARLREAVYELLAAISAQTPLLIVLDDMQWADGSSCELFGYVARRLSNRPVALLGTCRETELVANATLHALLGHMQREQVVEYLYVQPLADTEIATLVSQLPDGVVRHIQAQAAGNPFFAEELALSLRDQATLTLPKTITAALSARMQRLSEPCQQLLERAAVLGSSFGLPLLNAMETKPLTPVDEDVLLDLLDEAIQSGILTEEGTGTRVSYRFWHPLLATHLYTTLSETRRARLHRRAAEALQAVYATSEHGLREQAATILDHLVKGGAEVEQVAHFAELAADYAYTLSAYPEAERHYRRAIQAVEEMARADRLHLAYLLEHLAECVNIQGRFKEARALFERTLALYSAQGTTAIDTQEAQVQALLWSEIGWTWRYTGENERAWECCQRGEQILREAAIPAGPARARLYYQQSSLFWQEGQYTEARRLAMQALAVFQESSPLQQPVHDTAHLTRIRHTILGDPVDLGRVYALLGALANATGQRSEALEHLSKALAIYENYDRQRETAHVCNNIGHVSMKQARYQEARSFLQRAYTLAERIGDMPLMGVVLHNLGELALSSDQRDLQEAELYFKRSLLMAEQIDDREYLSRWNADLALALIERGNLTEATEHVARALSIARAMHTIPCVGNALVVLGSLRLAQARLGAERDNSRAVFNRLQRARRSLEHVLDLRGIEVETSTRGRAALAEILSLLGEDEQADARSPGDEQGEM